MRLWLGHYGPEQKKNRINSHAIIHCPTSSEVSKVSEQTSEGSEAREQVVQSDANERENGQASGPVLLSVFLAVLAHSTGKHWQTRAGYLNQEETNVGYNALV